MATSIRDSTASHRKKLLTIHATSHHHIAVKEHTIANMYQTAEKVSSNDRNKEHSERMIDTLLLNNGYSSRVLQQIKLKKERRPRRRRKNNEPHNDSVTTLKVPFLSDKCTAQVKRDTKDSSPSGDNPRQETQRPSNIFETA